MLVSVAAVGPPQPVCIQVANNNTSVTLVWDIPADPLNEFQSYEIYVSNNLSSGYSLLTTINTYTANTYTHTGVNLSLNNYYYYLKTLYNDGSGSKASSPSDTITPVIPQVTNKQINGLSSGFAEISWNKPVINGQYVPGTLQFLYKKTPSSTWQLIATLDHNTFYYSDTLKTCSDSFYYKIEVPQATCNIISAVSGEWIQDNAPPSPPVIDSVSIDINTGEVIVGWHPTDMETGGYKIFRAISGGWTDLGNINGIANTSMTDNSASSSSASETYIVAAFDTCFGTVSNGSSSHSTINLQAEFNQCEMKTVLNFTPYQGWAVSKYQVYVKENNGNFVLLEELNSSQFSYTHKDLQQGNTYCYFVRAFHQNADVTSSSNVVCINAVSLATPSKHYLSYVTVEDNNEVKISCLVDKNAPIEYFLIERRENNSASQYELLAQLPPDNSDTLVFTDNTADVQTKSYEYRVTVIDKCGNRVVVSNPGTTILTKIETDEYNFSNIIRWNAYEGWDSLGNGVKFYRIYKWVDAEKQETPLAIVDKKVLEYTDKVSDEINTGGSFCYQVEAVEAPGNYYGLRSASWSNIKCVDYAKQLFIPNAFTPNGDGLNKEFKPQGSFLENTFYSMQIFDRWGNLVFETNDVNEGWNGNGFSSGIYVYKINLNGKHYYGNVMLLR